MNKEKTLFGDQQWFHAWLKDCGCDVEIDHKQAVLNRVSLFHDLMRDGVDLHTPLSHFVDSSWKYRYRTINTLPCLANQHVLRKMLPYALIKVYRDSYIKVARCPLVNRNLDMDRETFRVRSDLKKEMQRRFDEQQRNIRMLKFEDFCFRFGPPCVPKVSLARVSTSDVLAREIAKLEKCPDWVEHRYDREYEKERCNLSRASNTILELSMCNDWGWFATFTVKKELMDRYDLPSINRKFSIMIRDLNDKFKCDIRYLSVPETHKDGAWHLHVMLMGVPEMLLKDFHMKSKIKVKLKKYISQGQRVAHIPLIDNAIGASTLIQIRDTDQDRVAIALYFKKYVTKDIKRLCNEKHKRLFYSSHYLKRAFKVFKGGMLTDFKFDYVKYDQSKILKISDIVPSLDKKKNGRSASLFRIACIFRSRGFIKGNGLLFSRMKSCKFVSYQKWCSWRSRTRFKDKPMSGGVGFYKLPFVSSVMYECSILKSPLQLFEFCCKHWFDGSEYGEYLKLDKLKTYFKDKGVLVNV